MDNENKTCVLGSQVEPIRNVSGKSLLSALITMVQSNSFFRKTQMFYLYNKVNSCVGTFFSRRPGIFSQILANLSNIIANSTYVMSHSANVVENSAYDRGYSVDVASTLPNVTEKPADVMPKSANVLPHLTDVMLKSANVTPNLTNVMSKPAKVTPLLFNVT